jgi:two-component system phosphate regulon sensor histidine kinase PhoR
MRTIQLEQNSFEASFRRVASQKSKDFQPSDFINSIIHEIKNPLNAIICFSEFLKQEVNNPKLAEECADYAMEINQAANDLSEIVEDLLEVGSIASGNFSVDLNNKISVQELIRRVIKLNYDLSLRRKIRLKMQVDDVDDIKLDMKRMKQILANLVSNAIKYSPENTEITVSAKNIVKDEQKILQISVADQGFGMDENQVKSAFEKYRTIENPNSGIVDSFGLGLPITKHLVEMQNGKISVKSEVKKGSEFILEFPYVKQ